MCACPVHADEETISTFHNELHLIIDPQSSVFDIFQSLIMLKNYLHTHHDV